VNRSARAAGLLAATALVLTGCGGGDEEDTATPAAGEPSAAAAGGECSPDSLETLEEGTLTIGTDSPAFEPWFTDDDPTNGQGFESAVAYAVAEELGYAEGDVTWTVAAFNSIISPAKKPFDIALNQVSITDERKSAVDFTSGYYTAAQTVITVAGSPIDGATTLADLKEAKLGAQVGTTSLEAIEEVVQPEQEPATFDTNDVAKTQLQNGQVDGIVVDLPTGLLHHRRRARRRGDRRSAAGGRRRRAGPVRDRAGQGQPADRVRHRRRRRPARGRHAGRPRGRVPRRRRRARAGVTGPVGAVGDLATPASALAVPAPVAPGPGRRPSVSPRQREREAYRRRQNRRSALIAALSTVVVLGALVLVVTSLPRWPLVQERFFDLDQARASLPTSRADCSSTCGCWCSAGRPSPCSGCWWRSRARCRARSGSRCGCWPPPTPTSSAASRSSCSSCCWAGRAGAARRRASSTRRWSGAGSRSC
jgi:polar amino acid transport system substrate-binding protein